jgi:predicted transcriptional regulator
MESVGILPRQRRPPRRAINMPQAISAPSSLLTAFVKDIGKDVVRKGLTEGNFSLKYLDEDIKIALAISNKFVSVGLFKKDGTYDQNRLLLSDRKKAISWALDLFKSYDDSGVAFNMD